MSMPHTFEPASSGRAKCRGCGQPIARGELRFGERLPNPFGEGEMTLWFHPMCAAYKQPDAILQTLAESRGGVPDAAALEQAARASSAHRRLPRVDGAERSPSGQARCRSCKKPIPRDTWRIRLVFFEEGRFLPGGFIHLDCRGDYFEGHDVLGPLLYFSVGLGDADRDELMGVCGPDSKSTGGGTR